MQNYITGSLIKSIREKKGLTQNQLAQMLIVSEKTISKWETGKGLPDISLIEPLSKALNVSIIELFNGEKIINTNKGSNIIKTKFYVCPICGNVITSIGNCSLSCCGIELKEQFPEEGNKAFISIIENEYYIEIDSRMTKEEYISFIAYVTCGEISIKKLYPEQSAAANFIRRGHGFIYYFDNKNGLFQLRI